MIQRRAIEFFSGMGSFAEACRGSDLQVVAAFDQDAFANRVYEHNFRLFPINSTLDSISLEQIPDAEFWWLSPPCTPYSVRGKRADLQDPRAKSLQRLMQFVEKKMPDVIVLENVGGFQSSQARQLVWETLTRLDYAVSEMNLCSTDFGTPMRRPRYFLIAIKSSHAKSNEQNLAIQNQNFEFENVSSISHYLDKSPDPCLIMNPTEFKKYEAVLNVVSAADPDAKCICFTKNYYRCRTASGSLLQVEDGVVRRFSSREILRFLGFSQGYSFPADTGEKRATGLLGNAVDVRMIRYLLQTIGAPLAREPQPFQEERN